MAQLLLRALLRAVLLMRTLEEILAVPGEGEMMGVEEKGEGGKGMGVGGGGRG